MKPKGNGIVELVDDKNSEQGFFCIKLVSFLNEEADLGTELYAELWRIRFAEAKAGQCSYREKCPIYSKSLKTGIQLSLFFD